MIEFPDISTWQDSPDIPGNINFTRMRSLTQAVIIKASQQVADPDFAINWRNSKAAGLKRGAYHFYDSRMSPSAQADLFVRTIGADYPEIGVWLDLEENYNGAYRSEASMRGFAERVRASLPQSVEMGVYTGPSWWRSRIGNIAYWKQYRLWIANYGVATPSIPLPWTEYFIWQYTSTGNGTNYGVESKEIDLNRYPGTWAQFFAAFGTSTPPPPPPPPDENKKITITIKIDPPGTIPVEVVYE